MSRGVKSTAILLLSAVLVLTLGSHPASAEIVDPDSESAPLGPLARDGRWIVDEHGRVMLLRGANQVWKGEPWVAPTVPGGIDDVVLSDMASHGWNVVRLGVYPKGIMPTRGDVDHGYLDQVAAAVEAFAAHGIYVLVDVHQDIFSGFPDWMVPLDEPIGPGTVELMLNLSGLDMDLPALPPALTIGQLRAMEPDLGFPLNGFRPSMFMIWDAFWGNDHVPDSDPKGLLDHTGDMMAALAARLDGHSAVVGIEIINESNPGSAILTCLPLVPATGCPLVDQLTQHAWQHLTDRMRQEAGDDLLIWWEPNVTWNFLAPSHLSSPPITPDVDDPQIAFAFHDYCIPGELSTYLGLPHEVTQATCATNHDLNWLHADDVRARTNWPLFVTEFGNSPDPAEAALTLERADARFAHWVQWTNGITDRPWLYENGEGDPYAPAILRQYVRSYPMATAGIPEALTFDADTGVMVYRYAPADLGVPTVFAVSDLHYPDGYEVVVSGGRVTSAPGAASVTPPIEGAVVGAQAGRPGRTEVTVEADAGVDVVEVIIRTAATPRPLAGAPSPPTAGPQSVSSGSLPATGGQSWSVVALGIAAVVLAGRRLDAGRR